MNRSTSLLFPLLLLVLVPMSASSAQKPAEAAPPDPTKAEVSLPASAGWCASLVYESDVGIWTNGPIACLPRHGHTLVGGDLSPTRPGRELLLFTRDGEVHDVRPRGDGSFDAPQTATLQGRVRQALILPTAEGRAARIVAACRTGELLLLGLEESGLTTRLLLERPMGFGRIALRPPLPGAPSVLYLTRDDGVILRLEERADGTWSDEIIYAGPQGPRGIAAGRFAADSATETVAVFGYSKKVQLLARTADGPWRVETIFEDRDKGHGWRLRSWTGATGPTS